MSSQAADACLASPIDVIVNPPSCWGPTAVSRLRCHMLPACRLEKEPVCTSYG
jgi:hypothetical protein